MSIRLHPHDHLALGRDELWGQAVVADETVTVQRLVAGCVEDAPRIEAAIARFLADIAARIGGSRLRRTPAERRSG